MTYLEMIEAAKAKRAKSGDFFGSCIDGEFVCVAELTQSRGRRKAKEVVKVTFRHNGKRITKDEALKMLG